MTQLLSIISQQTNNLNGCLQNCSSSGVCSLKNGLIGCQCFQFFTGSSCQFDTRPCASNPCLNNATCVNNVNNQSSSFKCQCQDTFYGTNCELQINLCQNVTCSGNGYCFVDKKEGTCKCFTSYSGENCEIELMEMKIVRDVQWTSTIIAFLVIGLSIIVVISNDVWNYLMRRKGKKTTHKPNPKQDVIRYKYYTRSI